MIDFGFYAPAGFATDPAAIDRAVARLTGLGHRVVVDATARGRVQRFSADDDERLAAIDRMAQARDVDVPVAVRGGYGWTRLLDRLDYVALAAARKRWLGHSDFTAFALAALARAGIVTYAGPMAAYDFGAEVASEFTLSQCFGVLTNSAWDVECALDGPARVVAEGTLWGGNLSMVAHLAGTTYLPDVSGGILFLEDVAEHPYRVERLLYQLYHAGVLERQRAVLLGAFTDYALHANDGGYDLAAAFAHLRARARVPIYTGLPFGHVRDKLTLPVGGRCRVEALDGRARLILSDYAADATVRSRRPGLGAGAPPFTLRLVRWDDAKPALRAVRLAVFVVEQSIPESLEWDEMDALSTHALAVDAAGAPIGCGRLLPDGHVGRMAVLAPWRGRGVGGALLDALVELASERGHARAILNAQVSAEPFYARHGFVATGEVFDEAGIDHRLMTRDLR